MVTVRPMAITTNSIWGEGEGEGGGGGGGRGNGKQGGRGEWGTGREWGMGNRRKKEGEGEEGRGGGGRRKARKVESKEGKKEGKRGIIDNPYNLLVITYLNKHTK